MKLNQLCNCEAYPADGWPGVADILHYFGFGWSLAAFRIQAFIELLNLNRA